MKAARVLIGAGLIFCALNLVAFFDLEKRARAIEAGEMALRNALDTATTGGLLQKGPPPRGMRVLGVIETNYGHDEIFDEMPVLGTWDGAVFSNTYKYNGEDIPRIIGDDYPSPWFPYPAK